MLQSKYTRYAFLFATVFMLLTETVCAQSVNKTKGGKGLQFVSADSLFSTKINLRIQSLYVGEYNLDSEEYTDQVQIRRSRLKFEGFAYGPQFEYKLELGLSNSDIGGGNQRANNNTANIILDAFVRWNITSNLGLVFGQTKLPGNRERVISSQKMQFVDRSLLNARYNIDRDAGVQLHHQFAVGPVVFREVAAVSMGEGRNITADNVGGYDFTGRFEVLPFGEFEGDGDYVGADLAREETPKLAVGVTYDFNKGASRERGQLGSFLSQQRDLKTFFADAMFKYRGFSAMAEYADKRSSGSPVVETDPVTGDVTDAFFTGTGFNIQAGYLFKNNFEIAGRYTSINPEALTQDAENKQYTLGLSKYILGHTVKAQTDVSLLREQQDWSNLMYRFQFEIGF
ncbi:porin [Rufibacter psychrotolerans]|uniref:porin n=1 Tax=Rufibacter psychrotolerans TaxID=2812556 RepID=UPI001F071975|nr:porin [Rufibacter sp. SYSU D00308]